jgi:hypothetical protein
MGGGDGAERSTAALWVLDMRMRESSVQAKMSAGRSSWISPGGRLARAGNVLRAGGLLALVVVCAAAVGRSVEAIDDANRPSLRHEDRSTQVASAVSTWFEAERDPSTAERGSCLAERDLSMEDRSFFAVAPADDPVEIPLSSESHWLDGPRALPEMTSGAFLGDAATRSDPFERHATAPVGFVLAPGPEAGDLILAQLAGTNSAMQGELVASDAAAAGKRAVTSVSTEPPGITPATRAAIDRGLAFLVSRQDRQGSWRNEGGYGGYPVAMTSLAGMALLMDGNTTTQGRYAQAVDRAHRYLVRSARDSGLISQPEDEARSMYGHGFSMTFLGQLYGMVESPERAEAIRVILNRAVDLTARSQSRQGGWIYTPTSSGDEGSVTITQVQALRSCRNAGIAVPKSVIDTAMDYLARSQNSDGGIRYRVGRSGQSRPPLSAAAACCWFNAGEYDNPRAARALAHARRNLPPDVRNSGFDFYAHLYLSQAMWVSDNPDWNDYYQRRRDLLLNMQREDGSWDADDVGEVYGTAVALIILQLPYNSLPLMQR